jgi:hypothetical protein
LPTPFAMATEAFFRGPISSKKAERSCILQHATVKCSSYGAVGKLFYAYLVGYIEREIAYKHLLLIDGSDSCTHSCQYFARQYD